MKRTAFRPVFVCLAIVPLFGCQTADVVISKVLDPLLTEDPPKVEATFEASADVNSYSSPSGGLPVAAPIAIRIYELKSDEVFKAAIYDNIYDNDDAVLAGDLQKKDAFVLRPGEKKELEMEFQPESRFLGVFAGYRDPEAQWRASIETPIDKTTRVVVNFGASAVSIEKK